MQKHIQIVILRQISHGIGGRTVLPYFKVQMRSGLIAGGADTGNGLAFYVLPDLHRRAIPSYGHISLQTIAVVYNNRLAITAQPVGMYNNSAVGRGHDIRNLASDINARMEFLRAKYGMHPPAKRGEVIGPEAGHINAPDARACALLAGFCICWIIRSILREVSSSSAYARSAVSFSVSTLSSMFCRSCLWYPL